jgi:hypothetical protein
MTTGNQSEVARLREQIAQEYQAAESGLLGLASVARHRFIEARMHMIEGYRQQLTTLVGEKEAATILAQAVWPND